MADFYYVKKYASPRTAWLSGIVAQPGTWPGLVAFPCGDPRLVLLPSPSRPLLDPARLDLAALLDEAAGLDLRSVGAAAQPKRGRARPAQEKEAKEAPNAKRGRTEQKEKGGERHADLEDRKWESDQREATLHEWAKRQAEEEERLSQLDSLLLQRAETMRGREEQLSARERTVAMAEENVRQAAEEIVQLKQQLQEANQQIGDLTCRLATNKEQLSARERTVVTAEENARQAAEEIAQLKPQLQNANKQIGDLTRRLATKKEKLTKARAEAKRQQQRKEEEAKRQQKKEKEEKLRKEERRQKEEKEDRKRAKRKIKEVVRKLQGAADAGRPPASPRGRGLSVLSSLMLPPLKLARRLSLWPAGASVAPVPQEDGNRDAAREEEASQILDWLMIGGQFAATAPELRRTGVTHVLNCSEKVPFQTSVQTCNMPVFLEDEADEELSRVLETAVTFLDEVRQRGGRCLVNCRKGKSRSVSIVLAYLVLRQGCSLQEAWHLVKTQRAVARPNSGFRRQLRQMEVCQRGRSSMAVADFDA
ncbi:MKP1 [Symbiodinium natans]|uniref:MKP1 protein n=1 Tax=Symbiodinium natans TaxID=878477 RepID=A0A812M2P9_9DINO|nr:MKP1 [Symbiodinium natans]